MDRKTRKKKGGKKLSLAIHTVFILRENILFLEEWIKYHIKMGFDKIYLYDNTGSIGSEGSDNKFNKYDINFSKLVTSAHTKQRFKSIMNKYKDYLVHIKWQPKNNKGKIIYGQTQSISDYIVNYGDDNDWTAFIDIDEYLYIKNKSIRNFITDKDNNNFTKIVIQQKKFKDHFCNLEKSVFEISDSLKHDKAFIGWAPKNICKNIHTCVKQNKSIHDVCMKKKKYYNCDINELRFNHYNINKKQIEWMEYYFKKSDFEEEVDKSMRKYISLKSVDTNYNKIHSKKIKGILC